MWWLMISPALLLAILAAGLLLRLLKPLPPRGEPPPEPPAGAQSRLAAALAPLLARRPGLSGVRTLTGAHVALADRVLLLRAAERTIDAQYYIWQGDFSGRLLLAELRAAADRGVRVRLLLDDNGTWGLDHELLELDSHPLASVRLFNPFTIRRPKAVGYVMDPWRLNRRMHNKSLTVDGAATIVGGRNIGDEYFGIGDKTQFADLDVLAVGAIVADVAADFERYWRARASYPLRALVVRPRRIALAAHLGEVESRARLLHAYEEALQASALARLGRGRLPEFEWARVRMVGDDPEKVLGRAPRGSLLIDQLSPLLGSTERSLALVSPYFVPTRRGRDALVALAGRGIHVTVLTNALDSTNQPLVHAGYAKHRRQLLAGGVRLHELKGEGKADLSAGVSGSRPIARPALRSGATALHAKTFAADRRIVFVGSFNFDPRSALLNTELGFLIESEALAGRLQDLVDHGLPEIAYEVRLCGRSLCWAEQTAAGEVLHRREPHTGPLQRLLIAVLAHLPIDWLL